MMTDLFSEDFDLTIAKVILAHKYLYTAGSVNDGYCQGRRVAGLVYCLSGSADYFLSHTRFSLRAGEMIFLPENAAYEVKCREDFHHITVNFQLMPGDGPNLISNMYTNFTSQLVIFDIMQAENSLQTIVDLWSTKPSGFRLQVKSLLYDLICRYFFCLRKQNRTPEYTRLRPAKELLDLQYHKNIPIAELAAACGFSQTHFRRLFAKEFLCSPVEYRLKKQLSKAKDLLLAGELSVSQIATAVGFSDANYFSRIFKERCGMSPSTYAASNMN